jgi:endonuclease/exonuclease/phosphatase family metal-dependent hydrolase
MTASASIVRLMTWNIHGAYGRNPGFDLARIIALIDGHRPDVIALQEIDSRRSRAAGTPDPFEVLGAALGIDSVRAKSVVTIDGDYGQAVISRWPIRNAEIHDISFGEREPRRAIRCEIIAPGGVLRVIATHLGLSIRERRGQAQALLALMGETPPTTAVVGDFNDWFWIGSVRKVLSAHMPARSRQRTFPSFCPLFRFDRIYCTPAAALVRATTDRAAGALSDHLPVIADIRLPLASR